MICNSNIVLIVTRHIRINHVICIQREISIQTGLANLLLAIAENRGCIQLLGPMLGTEKKLAFREVLHLWRLHLQRCHCTLLIFRIIGCGSMFTQYTTRYLKQVAYFRKPLSYTYQKYIFSSQHCPIYICTEQRHFVSPPRNRLL